jgi:hypothetical protein
MDWLQHFKKMSHQTSNSFLNSSDEDSGQDDLDMPGLAIGENSSDSETESRPRRTSTPTASGFQPGFLNNTNRTNSNAAAARRRAQEEAALRKKQEAEAKRRREEEAKKKKMAEQKRQEEERKKKEQARKAALKAKKEQEERERKARIAKENKSRQVIHHFVSKNQAKRKAQAHYRKLRKAIIKLQSWSRMVLILNKFAGTLRERVAAAREYTAAWGKLEDYVQKKIPKFKEFNWEDAMKRFDKMNVLEDGVERLANKEELESAIQTLDSAIQKALEENVEEEHEALEDDSYEMVMQSEDDEEMKEADALPEGVTSLEEEELPPPHKVDQIQLTKEVLKWFDRADSKYRGFFLRRIRQLSDGERSRILKKHLTGCKTAIWETYLDQKSGQRILWTECETFCVDEQDRKSHIEKGILVWYVAKHDDVNRLMRHIDRAENRCTEKLQSALTLFVETRENVLHLDDRNRILADPLGDTPLKLHLLFRSDIRKFSNKEWKPRLHLTAEELQVVRRTGTVLVLGRSGTGKTICIANRMDYDREEDKGVSQLFVARSRRICSYVRGLVEGTGTPKEGVEYLTFAKLVDKCERVLQIKQKQHASDWGDSRDPNQITYARFKLEIYKKSTYKVDPLIVWSQIRSFIKGSIEAVQAGRPLTRDEYLGLGKSRCRLKPEHREMAYSAYEAYQSFLESEPELWDDTDRIIEILKAIREASEEEFSKLYFKKVYVDEIQDYTQAEIALFFKLGHPGGLFLAGDTAQSVVEGVDFRFEEVRSIGHTMFPNDRRYVPDKPVTVNVNFRSHSGILNVAAGILDRMFKAFPKSANTLVADLGAFSGPRPGLLREFTLEKLKELVDLIDGVVLLTHDEHVAALKQFVGPDVLVFGIRYSKGLEFPHVVIVDFFSALNRSHNKAWKVLLSIRTDQDTGIENLKETAPEVETQLKLLYTAITRCSKRLFFAETKQSVAGDAFIKWCTVMDKPLAVKQTVDNVERLKKTADEWAASGINCGMEADNSEDLENAQMWLNQARFDFQKANSNELIDRTEAHLMSISFQMDISRKIQGPRSRLDREDEQRAAYIVSSLLQNSLVEEASKLMNLVLPFVSDYNKNRLVKEVSAYIPQPSDEAE